jgi:hypothetical protein
VLHQELGGEREVALAECVEGLHCAGGEHGECGIKACGTRGASEVGGTRSHEKAGLRGVGLSSERRRPACGEHDA